MEKIYAPFNPEQVKNLNEFQVIGLWHPFTCCSPKDIPECLRRMVKPAKMDEFDFFKFEGMLTASAEGWTCPCGKYTQQWAWEFMFDVQKMKDDFNETPMGKLRPIK